MKKTEAYDLLCKEYLSKCRKYGCDSCIAETFCVINGLRTDGSPQDDCPEKLKAYLRRRRLTGDCTE